MQDPQLLKLVFMIVIALFALIGSGSAIWLTHKAIKANSEGAGTVP